ncbi:hypothetical protein ACFL67_04265 [candidate division KSB1 bacterium]
MSATFDDGETFTHFGGLPGMGKGGSAAILYHENVIWTATAYDTTVSGDNLDVGGGLSWSDDLGETWHNIPQPVDPNNEDSLGYKPTTTNIQNVTFDIAIHEDVIWIASFGGGLRKSEDNGITWEVATPDGFAFAPLTHLNHRPFAVVSAGSDLWVGTAQGLNKSTDGGETWTNYHAQNSDISGNFVTAIAKQMTTGGSMVIWAATWKAEGAEEYYAVSRTTNGGLTWNTSLEGERVHNFGFDGYNAYAVSDNGLFKSIDLGENWVNYPWISDNAGNNVYTTEYYSAGSGRGTLWLGTGDGLIRSTDDGYTWSVMRAFRAPGVNGEPEVYAYPNPFSPARHNQLGDEGHVRFQYDLETAAQVTLDIFDFGMNPVYNGRSVYRTSGANTEIWNGMNNWGRIVANGVYFYRLMIDGRGELWGKIIVIN